MIDNYFLKFDEINALQADLDEDLNTLLNRAYNLLKSAYIEGWTYVGAMALLSDLAYSESEIEREIFKEIKGEDAFDRLEDAWNSKDSARVALILSTEYHRMFNTGEYKRADTEGLTHKKWVTMKDDRVRETHHYLEGISVPIDTAFITFDGDEAQYPGGFSTPENNCNCRCYLEFT